MPATEFYQSNFTAGELSPKLAGHVDFAKFSNGAEKVENFFIRPQGGVVRRPGSVFASAVRDMSKVPKLIPFVFTQGDAYALDFSDLTVQFYQNNEAVYEAAKTVTAGAWAAGLATLTIGAHTIVVGDVVKISGVDPAGFDRSFAHVTGIAATTITYALTVDPGAWASAGEVFEALKVVSPYAESDLPRVKYAQIADILYLSHPSYLPRKLVRNSATSWTLAEVDFLDGPYLAVNGTATTLQPSATTGVGITITASAVTGINDDQGFLVTDVGRLVRIKNGATWGYAKITAFTDTTHVTADVKSDFAASTSIATWHLGAWSETTGFPAAIAFHQQRLFFAGSEKQPTTIWGSKSAEYENMAPTDLDGTPQSDSAIVNTIASGEVNIFRWLASGRNMAAGGNGEITNYKGGDTSGAITATSVPELRPASTVGVDAEAIPVRVSDDLIFLQRGARKLRSMRFVFESDGFQVPDLTLLSDHITAGGVKEMAFADQPNSMLMCVKDNGKMAGCTFNIDEKIIAWHGHTIGGSFGDGAAEVESICAIPVADHDQIWIACKRTINGETTRFIEYLAPVYESETIDHEDAVLVDSAVMYDGAATTAISGLEHLEGETLEVLVDGATHPPLTVSNGAVTLETAASVVTAGLPYLSDLKPPRTTLGKRVQALQGLPKKYTHAVVFLLDTGELKFGKDSGNLDQMVFRDADTASLAAVPLFSGVKVESWSGEYTLDAPGLFRAQGPQPCSILGIGFHVEIGDRP